MLRRSPLAVAATAFVLYAGWIGITHRLHHEMTDFAAIGRQFVERSSVSPAINADKARIQSEDGYDGQFFLYIARDPGQAKAYIDNPSYRYGRIVYPLLARMLALGSQSLIPFMLVAVNLLAIALGTFAIGVVLRRHGQSPWYAFLFAAYPGIFIAVLRDLSEVLAYALAASAVAVLDRRRPGRVAASCALLAFAVMTRETTAVFALVCAGLLYARERRWVTPVAFAAGALLPYVLYRTIFLSQWLGHTGVPTRLLPTPIPLSGIGHYFPWGYAEIQQVYVIVLPGLFCLGLAVWALRRRRDDAGLWLLAANALVYVVLLPYPAYEDVFASSRVTTGVVVGFLLALPALAALRAPGRTWLWLPVIAWMAPWWSLLPVAFQTTF